MTHRSDLSLHIFPSHEKKYAEQAQPATIAAAAPGNQNCGFQWEWFSAVTSLLFEN
jgi:hypothetical protein